MDNLDNVMNNLSDQAKKYDIALYYTNGDQDKAKKMVANSYWDMVAIKAMFSSSSLFGAFILFFNLDFLRLEHSVFVISPDYQIQSLNFRDDWKNFEKEIMNSRTSSASSRINSDFSEKFGKGFTLSLSKELGKNVKNNDMTQITHMLQRFLQEISELKRIVLAVDVQKMSSLQMEQFSLSSTKVSTKVKAMKKKKDDDTGETASLETNEPQVGKDGIKFIIKSTLVLSPIKGKSISSVVEGDKIMVVMIENIPQVIEIAKAFQAFNAEQNKVEAVPARVTSVDYIDGIGYQIYAVIAKGIMAKVLEEERNIKIALDPSSQVYQDTSAPSKGGLSVPVIIGLVTVIIILLVAAVLVIF